LARKAHSFARLKFGKDLVLAEADDFTMCIEMIEQIKFDELRPEFINLTEGGCQDNGFLVCFEVCNWSLLKLGMYELEKDFEV